MITDPIRRTKLLKLARLCNFLDDLPHSKFFMPRWSSPDATEHSCGTAGCFAGWAATVYANEGWSFPVGGTFSERTGTMPQYGVYGGGRAFAEFFGLTPDMGLDLCQPINRFYDVPCDQITPQIAAAAGRRVLNEIDPTIVPEADGAMAPSVQSRQSTAASHDRACANPEHDRDALAQDVMGVGCGVEGGT